MTASGRRGVAWWGAWVVVCAPAGALAGVGLIEFNWGGPPYDGGFMGDLVLFGAFLALGQAPFVAAFVRAIAQEAGAGSLRVWSPAVFAAFAWPVAGLFGWTFGSYVEVPLTTPLPLYSPLRTLVGTVRWVVFGAAGGVVLALAVGLGSAVGRAGSGARSGRHAWRLRAALFATSAVSWVATSALGGLLYEGWAARDPAAWTSELNRAIGETLTGLGVAENVAFVVVPHALFVPLLYGLPTGFVFLAVTMVRGHLPRSGSF